MFDLREIVDDFFEGNQERAIRKIQKSVIFYAIDDFSNKIKKLKNKTVSEKKRPLKKEKPAKLGDVEILDAEIVENKKWD